MPPIDDRGLDKADQPSSIPVHLRYDIALLYLQQSDYNLGLAVEAYLADESTYFRIPYYPVLEQISSLETFLGSFYSRNMF